MTGHLLFQIQKAKKLKSKKTIFKRVFVFLFFCFLIFSPASAQAESSVVPLYFFYGDGCPHCAKEEAFLAELQARDPQVRVHSFETWYNTANARLLRELIQATGVSASGVPVLFVGTDVVNGYLNDATTGAEIERLVELHRAAETSDVIGALIAGRAGPVTGKLGNASPSPAAAGAGSMTAGVVSLPLVGTVDPQQLSLVSLTALIGMVDGFNPCAMWVLLFLISLLLGMQDRRRMWAIGLTFIAVSGAVYFLFLAAWLNIFLFIGIIFWVRLAIGAVALGSGAYHVSEFYRNREGACKVTSSERRRRVFDRLRAAVNGRNLLLVLFGIAGLAVAVNMVELVCSAGLPAIYTSILSAAQLAWWQYYAYLLLYIFFFMLDDIAVFAVAMFTLRVTGVTTRYVRAANFIGGVALLIIGILLIFKPEWILFG